MWIVIESKWGIKAQKSYAYSDMKQFKHLSSNSKQLFKNLITWQGVNIAPS